MLANLTEDILNFGDTALVEYFLPIAPYHGETNSHNVSRLPFPALIPDILPPLPGSSHIPTPLEASEAPPSNSASHGLSPLYPLSQGTDEGLSSQDLATL
jgi:hypothetical protein